MENSLFFGIALSLGGYFLGAKLQKKTGLKFLNPLLTSILMVIFVLVVLRIPFSEYEFGAKYLSYFLTPATVCLAVPLYRQLALLKRYPGVIFGSILVGALSSMGSIFLLCLLFQSKQDFFISMLPKSITTAIGMGLSEQLGGIPEISVAAIVITGILGNMAGEWLLRRLKVTDPIAVGLSLGTSAHAIGTAKALELGEVEGAMSSLSITVCGLLTVLFSSFFAGAYPL